MRDEVAFCQLGLRQTTADDEPFLLNLFASTRADELAVLNCDEKQKEFFIAMQFNAQNQQYLMSYPDAANSLILWDEVPIGRLIVDRGEREITLVDIALLPAHRGAGIGTHLIEELLRDADAAAKPVKLNVWYSNPARKLYERMGFSGPSGDDVYCEMWRNPAF